tara:strand:- start:26478 stop:26882 length:405 start_codon:yes stop_codon:yes gene_type:complete
VDYRLDIFAGFQVREISVDGKVRRRSFYIAFSGQPGASVTINILDLSFMVGSSTSVIGHNGDLEIVIPDSSFAKKSYTLQIIVTPPTPEGGSLQPSQSYYVTFDAALEPPNGEALKIGDIYGQVLDAPSPSNPG